MGGMVIVGSKSEVVIAWVQGYFSDYCIKSCTFAA
jgi:hypothetical protein